MKALTLWQPWASLIALGVKTIETRSWSTDYRGPLAIHAAKRRAKFEDMKHLVGGQLDAWGAWFEAGLVSDGETDNMPYGAVIATCELVDVVRIIPRLPKADLAPGQHSHNPHEAVYLEHSLRGELIICDGSTGRHYDDQLPYGDFGAGRFAWLLDKIEPLAEPIPARGRQQLWEWAA